MHLMQAVLENLKNVPQGDYVGHCPVYLSTDMLISLCRLIRSLSNMNIDLSNEAILVSVLACNY